VKLFERQSTSTKRDLERAQNAIDTLVRTQVAQGLAPFFFKRSRPYEDNETLSGMLSEGLLHRAAFIKKPPHLLNFYRWVLFAMEQAPESILEIGVKGGGSTALWKTLFPSARVIGMDIKLQRWLADPAASDGVTYVEGDQSDALKLEEMAREHGPFTIVIDDGSHVSSHQETTMRCLLPHVRPGGFYIVEDVHTPMKTGATPTTADYGPDIWADFTLALFERLRRGPAPPSTPGAKLARDISQFADDLIVSRQVLAVRIGERGRS